ncbi:MAG: NAD(P)(+) transhydrogenase (Re/Si-specific) subunit beta [Candidatus Dormibacteria bacterium]
MSTINTAVALAYLLAAAGFVVGLHLMNSPASARRGNQLSSAGMVVAVAVTLAKVVGDGAITATGWAVLGAGSAVGAIAGVTMARRVQMTAIPQLVSIFNAVGGGAAALIAVADSVRSGGSHVSTSVTVATLLDVIIGAVTFSGSLVAAGKLQGWIRGEPVVFAGTRVLTMVLAAVAVGGSAYLLTGAGAIWVLIVVLLAALVFGVTMVMPIGGADMPVVISLLNAFTGIAVAMAGFVIDSAALIIAGALVGASGGILTKLMADAMNRSILNIVAGGFGTGDTPAPAEGGPGGDVRRVSADDAAIQLAYAGKVVIVPGYGLAAAQAQHEVRQLADLLESRGADVSFAIHPVAGRMPGHMNVLLAEANVPYTSLREMGEANPQFPTTDVALVVGANDVTNPAARHANTPLSGMPILDVDQASNIIVIKRSMAHGYAGIDNELYTNPKTSMFFADAKQGLGEIVAAVRTLVAS